MKIRLSQISPILLHDLKFLFPSLSIVVLLANTGHLLLESDPYHTTKMAMVWKMRNIKYEIIYANYMYFVDIMLFINPQNIKKASSNSPLYCSSSIALFCVKERLEKLADFSLSCYQLQKSKHSYCGFFL